MLKSDLDHVLFSGAYVLCLIDAMIFGYSTFSALPFAGTISLGLRTGAAALILIKLILDRYYSLGSLLNLITVGLILLITYVRSGYSHIFYMMIVCLGLRGVEEERVISMDFWLRSGLSVLIASCGLLGLIEHYVTYRTGSAVLRYSVGFNHPNTAASLVLSLILEEAWIKRRHATGFYTVVLWIIAAVTYLVTANRTAVLIMLCFPILLFGVRDDGGDSPEENGRGSALAALFPLAAIFSYSTMIQCRSSELFRMIDRAMSNRFYNAKVIFGAYGVPLLGQKVALISVKTARLTNSSIALLDVAYLRLLIQAGPVVLVLLGILFGWAMKRARKDGDYLRILILTVFILFGLCESGFNNVFMNFSILFAAKALFRAEKSSEEVAL